MWALRGSTWLTSLCLVACAGQPQRQEHIVVPPRTAEISEGFPAAPPPLADAEDVCPMAVEGADVNLVPIKGGTAVVDSRGRTQGMLADDVAREGGAA